MDDLRTDILAGLAQDPIAAKYLAEPPPHYSTSTSGFLLHNLQIYIPDFKNLCLRIMQLKHDHPTAGHFGLVKTLDLIRREYYWPNLRSWESISMDLIEGIPESNEYDSILVIVERLTKMALFIPTTK